MHSLEKYSDEAHTSVVFAAALEGVDISPCLGGAERYIGFGNTKHGYGPACIVDVISTQYTAEPHVTWFPWTTPAHRIINFKWAMQHLAETRQVVLMVEKNEMAFFEHFVKKKILRKVGYIGNLPKVEEIHMYQYERKVS